MVSRDTDCPRWGEAFSLDDAARIRQALRTGATVKCPHCRSVLELVGESGDVDHTSLVSCHQCGRSLVLSLGGPLRLVCGSVVGGSTPGTWRPSLNDV